MRVGIAGTSIVSAYMTMVAMELRIVSTFHASLGILFPEGGGNAVLAVIYLSLGILIIDIIIIIMR